MFWERVKRDDMISHMSCYTCSTNHNVYVFMPPEHRKQLIWWISC